MDLGKKNHPTLAQYYKDIFPKLLSFSNPDRVITEHNVFQRPNLKIRDLIAEMCKEILLPGSRVENMENAHLLLQKIKEGKRALILMEHYSNFDLPMLIYLLSCDCDKSGAGPELAERIVAVAGMKLNEDNPYIASFAEGYARIVIYPSRSLLAIKDEREREAEEHRSKLINAASMRAFEKVRQEGMAVLVFPSGTRYRPGKPETKRGLREIYSYIRLSDVIMPVSINGNCLRIPEHDADMTEDIVVHDRMIMTLGSLYDSLEIREKAKEWGAVAEPDQTDRKQLTADYVMHILEQMHEKAEVIRLAGLQDVQKSAAFARDSFTSQSATES